MQIHNSVYSLTNGVVENLDSLAKQDIDISDASGETKEVRSISQIKMMLTGDLKPHPDNPRVHRPAQIKQIAKSIDAFGFQFPILIDQNNRIIAGHGRVMACEQLGIRAVPTLCVTHLSDTKIRALMIADNKLTENGQWDRSLLAQNFKVLSDSELELDFDIEVAGFDYGEIEELVMSIEGIETLGEDNLQNENNNKNDEGFEGLESSNHLDNVDITDDTVKSICQLGDIWQLGENRILCGDSLDSESYAVLLGDITQKAAMVFTDPPYNLSAKVIGKVAEQVHGDFHEAAGEMTSDEFTDYLSRLFHLLCEYSFSGSIHYICMDWRHLYEVLGSGKNHYSELKNICVWHKDRAGMGSFYRSQHEMVLVYKNGDTAHQNNFQLGQYGRCRTNVWSYPGVRGRSSDGGNAADLSDQSALSAHPTIKPISLVRDTLLDCSQRGEIVLDAFLGSGTTLLAAEQCHRRCMGIEIEPRYMDVAINRWQAMTGLDAIHQESGKRFNEVTTGGGN